MSSQNGFSLVELMIALALGLMVIAAATSLFLTAIRSQLIQQGGADLQENANFALNYITQDIRLANLNNTSASMDDHLALAGVVLSVENLPPSLQHIQADLLSTTGKGISNVTQGSDQLVIQYQPMADGYFDCEGRKIAANDVVIQRYFLRADQYAAQADTQPLALACDAGYYTGQDSQFIQHYGRKNGGETMMKGVDHFHVLLSVVNAKNQRRYFTMKDYMALKDQPKPRIIGVYLALLIRSTQSVGQQAMWQNKPFNLLDQQVSLNPNTRPQAYLHRVIVQEVAFRNALGARQ